MIHGDLKKRLFFYWSGLLFLPLEQTTDKLKDKFPEIDGENAKNTIFNLFDGAKPMFSFVFAFSIQLAKQVYSIFIKTLGRKYE